jgi:hypothetical protein
MNLGRDPLLIRWSVCAAVQPAFPQVSRCTRLSVSTHEYPALTGRSGRQRGGQSGTGLSPWRAADYGVLGSGCALSQRRAALNGSITSRWATCALYQPPRAGYLGSEKASRRPDP